MSPRRKKRLDPASFHLPVEQVRAGHYSDRAALRARDVLLADGRNPVVAIQFTAERPGVLGGTDEAIALLKLCVDDWAGLAVHALFDGDRVEACETVMTVEGRYSAFAHIASLCLGVLARRTRVSTNARALAEAARPRGVMVFPERHDHWLLQPGTALAAAVGGAWVVGSEVQSTAARSAPLSPVSPPVALVPHSLIAAYGGDTVLAARKFAEHVPGEPQLIVPVDYENDSVRTACEAARALPGRLWGVRLATSEYLVDRSIIDNMGAFSPTGVNPQLVWNVRNGLDAEGLGEVKILATGGFTLERIRQYAEDGVPVDAFGIGSALFTGRHGFTADVVRLDGETHTRAGHELRPNPRMERVK